MNPNTFESIGLAGYRLMFVCLGIYGWEVLSSLWYESWLVRRLVPFRWIYVPHLLGRYSLLVSLLLGTIMHMHVSPKDRQECIMMEVVVPMFALISHGCASLILMICTITTLRAISSSKPALKCAIVPLFLLAAGQWVVILTLILGTWRFDHGMCGAGQVKDFAILYIYTVVYDFVVLALSAFALLKIRTSTPLADLLLKHGAIYFVLALVGNFVSGITIFFLPPVLAQSLIFVPTVTVSTIASSRVVIRLLATDIGCNEAPHRCSNSAVVGDGQLTTNLPMHFYDPAMTCPRAELSKQARESL